MASILTLLTTDTLRDLILKFNANFSSLNGFAFVTRVTKSSAFDVWSDDTASVKPSYYAVTGTTTASMPAANSTDAAAGRVTWIKNIGVATVTVSPDGSDTIEGASSLSLSAGDASTLVSDGSSDWEII